MTDSFAIIFAQAAAATGASPDAASAAAQSPPWWTTFAYMGLIGAMIYFALIRPQNLAKKKQEEALRAAKTGDKVVTSSGIHGVITNVKDTTVIVKVADNVKLEIEKSHLDKIIRPETPAANPEKIGAAKVS